MSRAPPADFASDDRSPRPLPRVRLRDRPVDRPRSRRAVGVRPRDRRIPLEMAERQPIRPISGAKSFAGSAAFTPFHADSQDFLARRPASRSWCAGATRRSAASRACSTAGSCSIASSAPTAPCTTRSHARHACTGSNSATSRARPSPIGAGHFVWTHSPIQATDRIGLALTREIEREPVIELAVRAGETLLVHNHRMLHGRAAFCGPERDFVRVLAWFSKPLAKHQAPSRRTRRLKPRPAHRSA
jgi:hypothetical protein